MAFPMEEYPMLLKDSAIEINVKPLVLEMHYNTELVYASYGGENF
jgi:hypothetical protein